MEDPVYVENYPLPFEDILKFKPGSNLSKRNKRGEGKWTVFSLIPQIVDIACQSQDGIVRDTGEKANNLCKETKGIVIFSTFSLILIPAGWGPNLAGP